MVNKRDGLGCGVGDGRGKRKHTVLKGLNLDRGMIKSLGLMIGKQSETRRKIRPEVMSKLKPASP